MFNFMNNDPKISVITCLYNTSPELFNKTLLSIQKQTYKDFEVIIINDGSDKYINENKKLIENLKDDRFIFFDRTHQGKSQSLNFALEQVKGEFVAINDSDDQMYPERLEYQLKVLTDIKECDVLFNTMLSNPKQIRLPGLYPTQKIDGYNLNYLANHPVMMMRMSSFIKNVKLRFSQIYDSIEDNVFNYILYYSGMQMMFDETPLEIYNIGNPDALHYQGFRPYYKEAQYKLFFNTFNYQQLNPNFTVIILYNENWGNELEKTLLNIRLTSNNVKILIIDYTKEHKLLISPKKYNVIIDNSVSTYVDAFNIGLELCDTEYFMLMSKPLRFYNQNWDMYLERKFKDIYNYDIIQPYLFEINKIDEYNYENENGIDEYNVRTGLELQLLTKELTHKKNKLDLYFEYSTLSKTAILDEDMIFVSKTALFKNLHINEILNNSSSINVFISLMEWLNENNINIDTDFRCGLIDVKLENITSFDYYTNLYKFAHFFLNETKFLYDKLLLENLSKDDYNLIVNNLNADASFHTHRVQFTHKSDISYFLKNINLQYNLWIQ